MFRILGCLNYRSLADYRWKRRIYRRLLREYRQHQGCDPQVNREALFVFGNQKSGTTAIAALLSNYAGLSPTLDIKTMTVVEYAALRLGLLSIDRFTRRHAVEFSRDLVKEPSLTFHFDALARVFPLDRSIFVVRDPRENVRSILDRLALPGDIDGLPAESARAMPVAWQRGLDGTLLASTRTDVAGVLAERWLKAVDVYMANRDRMILVRYEDFALNKLGVIATVAEELGLSQRGTIENDLDRAFQPPGRNRVAGWQSFLSRENVRSIEEVCAGPMSYFGYETSQSTAHEASLDSLDRNSYATHDR